MNYFLSLLFLFFSSLSFSQKEQSNGIKWVEGLTWEQVKQNAKQENRYILVDCYATWCVPCKRMDKETYVNPKVISAVNANFIAVKVQMDSTNSDSKQVQRWYRTADGFNQNYKIQGYPAYLFFSPSGELIHQDLGYKNVDDFMLLIKESLDSSLQDSKVIESFKQGKRDSRTMLRAALAAKKMDDKKLADSIARAYKTDYLDKLDDLSLFTKDNIRFVTQDFYYLVYEDGSKGRFFNFFYGNVQMVDSLVEPGFAEFYIKGIITQEELTSKLFRGTKAVTENPNWDSLTEIIANKYTPHYANEIISNYKPLFYLATGNWREWVDLFDKKISQYQLKKGGKQLGGFSDDWTLNNNAWTVFRSCTDKKLLLKALQWVDLAIKLKDGEVGVEGYLDTKANLLYKLGRAKKAIKTEEEALRLNTKFARQKGNQEGNFFQEFSENINKMKKGLPTWKVR